MRVQTRIFKIDQSEINYVLLRKCAEMIQEGKLVVFPSETVYGLGANALDSSAVKKIFLAKGRPSDNPLIVHVSSYDMLESIVEEIPKNAKKLMDKFWPGPLTIVFKKKKNIPKEVTCGLKTVAVRMPAHPVAFELIRESGLPIAAPSANLSGKPSCTYARHVIDDLYGRVDAIIDGGDSRFGLESTVIDVSGNTPVLLRPGAVTLEELEKELGRIDIADPSAKKPKSPGMKYRHYAPKTPLILLTGKDDHERLEKTITQWKRLMAEQKRAIVIGTDDLAREARNIFKVKTIGQRKNLNTIASNIFRILREVDKEGYDYILIGACSEEGIGLAIMNRIRKAATEIL